MRKALQIHKWLERDIQISVDNFFRRDIMPLFGKKNDGEKKHPGKESDIKRRYEFKKKLGT